MKKQTGLFFIFLSVSFSLFVSCKKKNEKDPYADVKGNYFSIRRYALDEWNSFHGTPFVIVKTMKEVKGDPKKRQDISTVHTDSSYTNSDTLNWGNIFDVFFAADISDRKFLGHYTFSQFDDTLEGTHNYYYKADDDDLFTQKLLLTADINTNKVRGLYIETYKKTIWTETKQNLYYAPMRTVQIQTDERPSIGSRKYSILQYYFQNAN